MKIYFVTAVVVLLVCSLDFYSRLAPKKNDSEWRKPKNEIKHVDIVKLEESLLDDLNKALEEYDVVKAEPIIVEKPISTVTNQVKLMSDKQQANQQGLLRSLFDDVFEYTLRATFNDNGSKFALIEKKNLQSPSKENVYLKVGQSLSGYIISNIQNTAIFFEQGERKIQLQLFKQQTP